MSAPLSPRLPIAGLAVSLLGGCVSFSPDAGLSSVVATVGPDLGRNVVKITGEAGAAAAAERVKTLLRGPLTADRAAAIALLNNRGLQAAYFRLGISEAEYVQASLPPNPKLSLAEFSGPATFETEQQLVTDIVALVTLPARTDIAADRFGAAKLRAAEQTLRLAADARRQYYRAVAASEAAAFLRQARLSAEAASDLTRQLGETGAVNKADQAREHALYAEVASQFARATLQARLERERLVRVMGLYGRDIQFTLPAKLPPLPGGLRSPRRIEADAVKRRVDLKIAFAELGALAKSLELTKVIRYVPALEIGPNADYQHDKQSGTYGIGIAGTYEIPIFDFGQARIANAEQTYMQAANLLAQKAVNARSEAREAYQNYRGTYDIARLYERQILPLREMIQADAVRQYNGMLIDVAQLILDARARVLSNAQAIEARRDFWIANADLNAALIGGGMAESAAGNPSAPDLSGRGGTSGSAGAGQ